MTVALICVLVALVPAIAVALPLPVRSAQDVIEPAGRAAEARATQRHG